MHKAILERAAAVLSRVRSQRRESSGDITAEIGAEELREERSLLEELVNRTMDVLGGEKQYLESLEQRYDATGEQLSRGAARRPRREG